MHGKPLQLSCPKCGSPDEIDIEAIVTVRLTGTGTAGDALELRPRGLDRAQPGRLRRCGYSGTIRDFERTGKIILA